uniref:PLAC8 like 1 n=1 Tax=Astyanax mexicanus TaxID=7994 RepID=A0A8B9JTP9_ASTMX
SLALQVIQPPSSETSSFLLSPFSDFVSSPGLMGMFVPCCLDLSLAHQYGECLCLPLLPGSTFAMRVGIRERFKIRGNVCEDWAAVYFCYPLALCQMIREMKRRLKSQVYTVSTALECS